MLGRVNSADGEASPRRGNSALYASKNDITLCLWCIYYEQIWHSIDSGRSDPNNRLRRISFEAGGNAPFIVFDDADVE